MSIVETVRQPLLVLDTDLRIRMANRAFYRTFQMSPLEAEGQVIYSLSRGRWDLPGLRDSLDGLLQGGNLVPGLRSRAGFSRRGAQEPGARGLPHQSSQDDSAGGRRHHRAQTGPAGPAQERGASSPIPEDGGRRQARRRHRSRLQQPAHGHHRLQRAPSGYAGRQRAGHSAGA